MFIFHKNTESGYKSKKHLQTNNTCNFFVYVTNIIVVPYGPGRSGPNPSKYLSKFKIPGPNVFCHSFLFLSRSCCHSRSRSCSRSLWNRSLSFWSVLSLFLLVFDLRSASLSVSGTLFQRWTPRFIWDFIYLGFSCYSRFVFGKFLTWFRVWIKTLTLYLSTVDVQRLNLNVFFFRFPGRLNFNNSLIRRWKPLKEIQIWGFIGIQHNETLISKFRKI